MHYNNNNNYYYFTGFAGREVICENINIQQTQATECFVIHYGLALTDILDILWT